MGHLRTSYQGPAGIESKEKAEKEPNQNSRTEEKEDIREAKGRREVLGSLTVWRIRAEGHVYLSKQVLI